MRSTPRARRFGEEWLLTTGNGGYAMGRALGARTRSYHGCLVAALPAPDDRVLVLARVDEAVHTAEGEEFLLGCQIYSDGTVFPRGDSHIVSTRDGRDEQFCRYSGTSFVLDRRLSVGPGNRGRLEWSLQEGDVGEVRLRPFPCWRSHHGGESAPCDISIDGSRMIVDFEGRSERLVLAADRGRFEEAPVRHDTILLLDERERGLPETEWLESPGELVWRNPVPGERLRLDFQLEDGLPETPRRRQVADLGPGSNFELDRLAELMLDFLIHAPRTNLPGIVAGYPWFNEWGRDTMIALPGLAVALGSSDLAVEILEAWAERMRNGLLPNRLSEDAGDALYNSVDAPLWFARAVHRFARERGRRRMPALLERACDEMIEAYSAGTDEGIGVDPEDGLLVAGDGSTQLTWMDASIMGEPVTPRYGKCVELQALFHEALLDSAESVASVARENELRARATRLSTSFYERFRNGPGGFLHDCVDGDESRLRPNQFVALGSPRPLLGSDDCARMVAGLERALLTPRGPRTLAPFEPGYRGRYEGGPETRDRAYHQGCVWPWLLGPWGDARMRSTRDADADRLRLETQIAWMLLPLERRGQVPEIHEGDSPHRAVGAPAQAWSVAEPLRLFADHELDRNRFQTIFELMLAESAETTLR